MPQQTVNNISLLVNRSGPFY